MIQLLGLVLLSFIVTSFLLVPFIDFLFFLRNKFKKSIDQPREDFNPTYNKLMEGKDNFTPVGGGILLIPVIVILSFVVVYYHQRELNTEILILAFTFISFGIIGFLDDFRKIFADFVGIYPGIRARYLIIFQSMLALIVASLLYYFMGLNNVFIPILGNLILGLWYVPFAAFIIVSFSNAYNIADGLDGLAAGLLMICLFAFLVLASAVFDITLSIFVGVWIGALIAFLYFNVIPARIYLGDAGAYAFGACLAVIGLLTGKILGLAVIGGMFIAIIVTSMIQILSKKIFKKKVFPIAPVHLTLRYLGWSESKVVMRMWLIGVIFAITGLYLALVSTSL